MHNRQNFSGSAAEFLEFLTSDLQPYVERKFGTNGTNVLFGASNAGLFTLYALLEKPEYFKGYISPNTMIGHCKPFMEELHSRVQVIKAGGHVPPGSIAAGLDYIYSEMRSD